MLTVLAGGVGAARFLEGVVQVVPPATVTAVVNTGDDFVLHGLVISPDLDIVTCTLADLIDREQGWGIAGDTDECMQWLGRLGGPTWFKLGDRDLALHIRRTALLSEGESLTAIADQFRQALGVAVKLVPMSDDPAPTHILTPVGEMHFEEYFVRRRAQDRVTGVRLHAAGRALPSPDALAACAEAAAIVIAPSNPVVSVGPIVSLPGMREAIRSARVPVVAVSPIVGGAAIKGPAAPLMQAMGMEVSALGVARAYADLIDGIVIDQVDADLAPAIAALGLQVAVTDTIMRGPDEKAHLAAVTLALADQVRQARYGAASDANPGAG
ncbi:2-phospho-L-lactate transferase [Candidatus Chloroploca asiatica]|uniref:2-phospho-L-lactate transferase n=1 Tax=Candidatus Chloroploca asiatica TaxID=1506545 RepID=A0A2H3L5E2_9CHLR|nr:2-phospho-L-lactate transferase [Candidatus Chloroploca asiatica]PDW00108.1 2-phospho-L-lactate transferase [Candidatus Chloroploca asiatica]